MDIDKAIEILSYSAYRGVTTFDQDFKDAEKLGTEAMIKLKKIRLSYPLAMVDLLPGETAE